MNALFIKLKEDGSIYKLKWIVIIIIIFSLIGFAFGILKVVLTEQTQSGRYAVYQICDPNYEPIPDQPCDVHVEKVVPLGQRAINQAKFFALLFGIGPGLAIGATIGDIKWKKRKEVKYQ